MEIDTREQEEDEKKNENYVKDSGHKMQEKFK